MGGWCDVHLFKSMGRVEIPEQKLVSYKKICIISGGGEVGGRVLQFVHLLVLRRCNALGMREAPDVCSYVMMRRTRGTGGGQVP